MTFVASWDGSEEPYYLFVPSEYEEPLPLVVVLHGKGATWRSWFEATDVCDWAERERYAVIAPHGRGDWFYQGPGESDTLDAIDHVMGLLPIDENRVYLLGHSMGGWGTWHLGLSHPNRFATIVPMSCWVPERLLPGAHRLDPLIIHGADDGIVPPIGGRLTHHVLSFLQYPHSYVEIPGRGHESSMISESFDMIGEWLRERQRVFGSFNVNLRAYTPRRGRNAWLQLAEVDLWTGLASIDVQSDGVEMYIHTDNVTRFLASPPVDGMLVVHLHGQTFELRGMLGDMATEFRRTVNGWEMQHHPRAMLKPPPARILFEQKEPLEEELPGILARAISRRFPGAALVFVSDDLVAPKVWSGPFTEDHLLDLFLHPDDEIRLVTVDAAEARRLVEERDTWYPAWWKGLTALEVNFPDTVDASVTIAVPLATAKRLPHESRATGVTLRRLMYEQVEEVGALE